MIPKIIHWCWLSTDLIPENLNTCMISWDRYLPEYKKIHWNFSRFNIDDSIWVKEAFQTKKYAFAADYIRLFALYNYGGFYLDMDVEVIKSFDQFLKLPIVLCWQKDIGGLEVAAFGVQPHSPIIKLCLDRYNNRHFIINDGKLDTKTLPKIVEDTLLENGYKLINVNNINEALDIKDPYNIPVFPSEFFSPKSYLSGRINITSNTFCIHHFAGSWLPQYMRFEIKFWNLIGVKNLNIIHKIINALTKLKIIKYF